MRSPPSRLTRFYWRYLCALLALIPACWAMVWFSGNFQMTWPYKPMWPNAAFSVGYNWHDARLTDDGRNLLWQKKGKAVRLLQVETGREDLLDDASIGVDGVHVLGAEDRDILLAPRGRALEFWERGPNGLRNTGEERPGFRLRKTMSCGDGRFAVLSEGDGRTELFPPDTAAPLTPNAFYYSLVGLHPDGRYAWADGIGVVLGNDSGSCLNTNLNGRLFDVHFPEDTQSVWVVKQDRASSEAFFFKDWAAFAANQPEQKRLVPPTTGLTEDFISQSVVHGIAADGPARTYTHVDLESGEQRGPHPIKGLVKVGDCRVVVNDQGDFLLFNLNTGTLWRHAPDGRSSVVVDLLISPGDKSLWLLPVLLIGLMFLLWERPAKAAGRVRIRWVWPLLWCSLVAILIVLFFLPMDWGSSRPESLAAFLYHKFGFRLVRFEWSGHVFLFLIHMGPQLAFSFGGWIVAYTVFTRLCRVRRDRWWLLIQLLCAVVLMVMAFLAVDPSSGSGW